MPSTRILYVSQLRPEGWRDDAPFAQQLAALNQAANATNRELRVRGLLLYGSGHFLQVLEGSYAVVNRLMDKIADDPRHTHVERLLEQAIAAPLFDRWNMGLLNLDLPEQPGKELFAELLPLVQRQAENRTAEEDELVVELLRRFKDCLRAAAPAAGEPWTGESLASISAATRAASLAGPMAS